MKPFYRTVDLDGWTVTVSRSDTIDLTLEGSWLDKLIFHLSPDQVEALIAALNDASEQSE